MKPLDPHLLDDAWNLGDPAASETHLRRLRAEQAGNLLATAELDTQIARALGLAGEFDDATALLASISFDHPLVRTRVALERGRVRNSGGDSEAAIPLFEQAQKHAVVAEDDYLQVDALHMLAIADSANALDWTRRGLEIAEASQDPRVRRWLEALHNNLAWTFHDGNQFDAALAAFDAALAAHTQSGSSEQVHIAQWSRARCLRSLGRLDEARDIQLRLKREGPPDPYVDEELAMLREMRGEMR